MDPHNEDYASFTREILGAEIPFNLQQTKLHAIYPEDSIWFRRSFDSLLAVELEFAQELIYDLRRRAVPGALVEFGVYRGKWVRQIHEMTERAGLGDREIYGFDSFKGLSAPHAQFDIPFWNEGMYAVPKAEVEAALNTTQHPRIRLVEGFFSESLRGEEARRLGPVAFAHIDCDIYEPALQCLHFLGGRLSHGALLVFDDWPHDLRFGEGRAFAEWLPAVPGLRFEFLGMGPWDHLYLRVWHRDRPATDEDDQITHLHLLPKDPSQ